jgi:hypothetical protein
MVYSLADVPADGANFVVGSTRITFEFGGGMVRKSAVFPSTGGHAAYVVVLEYPYAAPDYEMLGIDASRPDGEEWGPVTFMVLNEAGAALLE